VFHPLAAAGCETEIVFPYLDMMIGPGMKNFVFHIPDDSSEYMVESLVGNKLQAASECSSYDNMAGTDREKDADDTPDSNRDEPAPGELFAPSIHESYEAFSYDQTWANISSAFIAITHYVKLLGMVMNRSVDLRMS